MSVVEPGPARPKLVSRALRLLVRPSAAWREIAAEPTTAAEIYKGYVAPLAAIPAVCMTLGLLLFPLEILDLRYKSPVPVILAEAALGYLLAFAQVFVLAQAIDLLAPAFGGQRNRMNALKLAAYSVTPLWLAGVFMLLPSLGWLLAVLGGVYGLYLLNIGLPRLMKPAPDKALSYFALVLIASLVLGVVAGAALTWVSELGGPVAVSVFAPQG